MEQVRDWVNIISQDLYLSYSSNGLAHILTTNITAGSSIAVLVVFCSFIWTVTPTTIGNSACTLSLSVLLTYATVTLSGRASTPLSPVTETSINYKKTQLDRSKIIPLSQALDRNHSVLYCHEK